MASLRILGVRHHSPACARRVQEIVREVRPELVLIEGPADMNERLDELRLAHELPIAVYSYRLDEAARGPTQARGTWTPFCDYSPEWVALKEAAAIGARALFIDLPAWDDAFHEILNRFGEGRRLSGEQHRALAERHGFDCTDALWDHLFEADEGRGLEARLEEYFDALRGDDPTDPMNERREANMAAWIAWAMARAEGTVLVVCGGYHAPALRALHEAGGQAPDAPPPAPAPPPGVRVGSFLVPFSFKRLDSFAGYAAGMPSPAYYQAVWDRGAEAPWSMLHAAVRRLREKGQVVSTADLAAASVMTEGLAMIRGHASPTRVDTLDGLVSALLKEPIDAPLPWSERRVLAAGTSPLLVELVDVYSGARVGRLAEQTPLPPLVHDVRQTLAALDLTLGSAPRRVSLSSSRAGAQPARHALYRLRVLQIPGVERTREAGRTRGGKPRGEQWRLHEHELTLPTLIERSVYGASLAQAARARLLERVHEAPALEALVTTLLDAADAGFFALAEDLSGAALQAVEQEASLAAAGRALGTLVSLSRRGRAGDVAPEGIGLRALLEAVLMRAAWLLEGAAGNPALPFAVDGLRAVAAVALAADELATSEPRAAQAAVDVFERAAASTRAPVGLRGACLGALWSRATDEASQLALADLAVRVTTGVRSEVLGELLTGLAVTAREQMQGSALLDAVDDRLRELEDESFLVALPALRRAFSQFPPRERLRIAQRVLARAAAAAGPGATDAAALIAPLAPLDDDARETERELFALLESLRLLPEAEA